MKKFVLIPLIVLLVLTQACNTQKDKFKGKMEGKVKRETQYIAPKVAGRVIKIIVTEADVVKAHDTLAIIDIPEVEAKCIQAQGAYFAAKAQYEMAVHGATSFEREQINAKLNAAREQFAFAEKSFRRIENMMKDSLIAMQKYDEVFEKYQSAKAQLDAVKAQKDDIDHGVRKEKTDMAFGDMKRAEGVLKEVQTAYNERFICAPKNMTIETIAVKQGELALPGYNMFVGYETEGTYFRFTVNEDRVANFEKGKTYQVEVPALKKTIPAKLTGIKQLASYADKTSSYADYELGETVYELKLIPVNPEETAQLYSNMTVLMNK